MLGAAPYKKQQRTEKCSGKLIWKGVSFLGLGWYFVTIKENIEYY